MAAYEPGSGYADPSMTASSFLAAARDRGARLVTGAEVTAIPVDAAGSRACARLAATWTRRWS